MTTPLECAVSESVIKPLSEPPLLSIVVPTHNRPTELIVTIRCLAEQLTGGLEDKVEILISDNGSGPDTIEAIQVLAVENSPVSYMLNARDEGGFFNFFAAPWRARGRYTWVFGSDDVLLDGGVAHVAGLLDKVAPSFMTLNKQVVNADLTVSLWESTNAVEDRRFDSFIELFCALGINQFAFISGQIELTEAARKFDAEPYLRTSSRHPHVAAYLEKHAHAPSYYCSANHLVHRNDNSSLLEYHAGNFFDYGVTFPLLFNEAAKRVGAPAGLFEKITGHKRIADYEPSDLTLVDAMFENLLRAMAYGHYMNTGHKRALESLLAEHGREDRLAQFEQLWLYSQRLVGLERAKAQAKHNLAAARDAALQTSAIFTRSTRD